MEPSLFLLQNYRVLPLCTCYHLETFQGYANSPDKGVRLRVLPPKSLGNGANAAIFAKAAKYSQCNRYKRT
jgi:hypothetical protein